MGKFQVKEVLGNQYIYVSKNATSDVSASNYFGKAAAWVAGNVYAIGDRVTSVSIQYYNKTGVNTATAPASDSTNWGFDKANFGVYATAQVYAIGDKTNYSNEHYVCIVSGSTSTFQPANWTKVVVSNKDVPYLYLNTAIGLANGDARFVSYELLDYPNNRAYHKIHILISNGVWNETLTPPSKYMRFVGQSKWKTKLITSVLPTNTYTFLDSIYVDYLNINGFYIRFQNCVAKNIGLAMSSNVSSYWYFCYKNIFIGLVNLASGGNYHKFYCYHIVNNYFDGLYCNLPSAVGVINFFTSSTVIKNNYFNSLSYFGTGYANLQNNAFDNNYFVNGLSVAGSSKNSLSLIQAAFPNQNLNSYYSASATTLNNDYTLPANSPLLSVGYGGVNIGAENRGYNFTTSTLLNSDSGAIYRNITKFGTVLQREQVNKFPQSATDSGITLSVDASTDYVGFRIRIIDGLGINQTRTILSYDSNSKIATVDSGWTITPDQYSIYEILDGEVTSAVGDLGGVKNIKNFNFLTNNIYDAFGKYQQISSYSNVDDYPDTLDFYMRSGMGGAGVMWRKFTQDNDLNIDSVGRSSGDDNFDANNITTASIPMRYFQIKIQLHKN